VLVVGERAKYQLQDVSFKNKMLEEHHSHRQEPKLQKRLREATQPFSMN